MPPTITQMQQDLDWNYMHNPRDYNERLQMIKGLGYKVLRNSRGQHKLVLDMSQAFGGVFAGIFGE